MTTPLIWNSELSVPVDGSDTDAWGTPLVLLHSAWDRFHGGECVVVLSSSDYTLTTDEAQCGRIVVAGNISANRTIWLPSRNRTWHIANRTTGTGSLFARISGASNFVDIPRGGAIPVCGRSVDNTVFPAAPPVQVDGSFLGTIRHTGKAYDGPGIYFSNRALGFGTDGADLHFFLADIHGGPGLKMHAANTAQFPLIGFTSSYNTGFFYPSDDVIGFSTGGASRVQVGPGLLVGSPSGGMPVAGVVNASNYQRNGVALPIQDRFSWTGLNTAPSAGNSTAHSMGAAPVLVHGRLRCTSTDLGYAVGDLVTVQSTFGGDDARGVNFGGNATHLFFRVFLGGIVLTHKTSSTMGAIDPAKWDLELFGFFA
jgi:hypothetical protein